MSLPCIAIAPCVWGNGIRVRNVIAAVEEDIPRCGVLAACTLDFIETVDIHGVFRISSKSSNALHKQSDVAIHEISKGVSFVVSSYVAAVWMIGVTIS
jgi:hypothetical protein